MNHSNLPDLKQKQGCYGFMGWPPSLSPSGFWEVGWSTLSVFFVWHWLLCSWHLSPFPVPTSPSPPPCLPFLRHPLPALHGNCTGLCVCVHVCACIYMYREIYMWGWGKQGGEGVQLRVCSQDAAPLEPVTCPSGVGEVEGRWEAGFSQAGPPRPRAGSSALCRGYIFLGRTDAGFFATPSSL